MSWLDLKNTFLEGLTQRQQRQVTVSLFMIAVSFHILWVCGLLPGFEGFVTRAQAEAVAQARVELLETRIDARLQESTDELKAEFQRVTNDISVVILTSQMEELQAQKCASDDTDLRQEYTERISLKMARYREIKGFFYNLTPCVER